MSFLDEEDDDFFVVVGGGEGEGDAFLRERTIEEIGAFGLSGYEDELCRLDGDDDDELLKDVCEDEDGSFPFDDLKNPKIPPLVLLLPPLLPPL